MTDLRRRLARLEVWEGRGASLDGGVVILPPGLAAADADAFVATHRERTGWTGTVVVLQSNGREAPQPPPPPRPAPPGPWEQPA